MVSRLRLTDSRENLLVKLATINRIAVLLHPLHELQVIKWSTFNEFAHFNVLHTSNIQQTIQFDCKLYYNPWLKEIKEDLSELELVEHILKHLVVLNHLVLTLGVEINLVHRHSTRVNRIHELTVNRAWTSLLINRSVFRSTTAKLHREGFEIQIQFQNNNPNNNKFDEVYGACYVRSESKTRFIEEKRKLTQPLRLWRDLDAEWSWSTRESPFSPRNMLSPLSLCSQPSPIYSDPTRSSLSL